MKRKIVTCTILVIVVLVIIIATIKGTGNLNVTSTNVEPSLEIPGTTDVGDDADATVTNKRELKFDDKITVIKDSSSYVESIDDMLQNIYIDRDLVDDYDYSNGFILKDSDNITVGPYGFNSGLCYGADEVTEICVTEEDALKTTIQQLRLDKLNEYSLQYYIACNPLDIPRGTKVLLDTGIVDYENYFEEIQPYTDPSHNDICQVMCDTVTDTAFGSTLYMEIYNSAADKYYAYAYILCERDRILSISISSPDEEYLWSYLIELTNDVITLVK